MTDSLGQTAGTRPEKSLGGRRLTARRKLLAAGYEVIGRRGLEKSTIGEIVEEARVGVGSFYNHFASKEELAKAIFAERGDAMGAALEQAALNSVNVAAATCYAFRTLIETVEHDQAWAAFIVQLEPRLHMLDGLLRDHARVGIKAGIDRGQLNVGDIETGITAFHALMIAIAQSMLDGNLSTADAHRSSVYALRMFGIPEQEAVRLSNLSMADLRGALGQSPEFI
jgi:AcrR family transcriptional regulator